jgi:hypothetical protein
MPRALSSQFVYRFEPRPERNIKDQESSDVQLGQRVALIGISVKQ